MERISSKSSPSSCPPSLPEKIVGRGVLVALVTLKIVQRFLKCQSLLESPNRNTGLFCWCNIAHDILRFLLYCSAYKTRDIKKKPLEMYKASSWRLRDTNPSSVKPNSRHGIKPLQALQSSAWCRSWALTLLICFWEWLDTRPWSIFLLFWGKNLPWNARDAFCRQWLWKLWMDVPYGALARWQMSSVSSDVSQSHWNLGNL